MFQVVNDQSLDIVTRYLYMHMYVSMYLCIYVSMYLRLCIYVSTYPCIYVHMYLCIYVCILCIYVSMYLCIHVSMYPCISVCFTLMKNLPDAGSHFLHMVFHSPRPLRFPIREGFMGAAVCTSVTGWLMGRWLSGVDWLTSPRNVFLGGGGETMDVVGLILLCRDLSCSVYMCVCVCVHCVVLVFWQVFVCGRTRFMWKALSSTVNQKKERNTHPPEKGGGGRRGMC